LLNPFLKRGRGKERKNKKRRNEKRERRRQKNFCVYLVGRSSSDESNEADEGNNDLPANE
jgi:hypothetical protein